MKKKDNRKSFSDFDKFDRKQSRHSGLKEKDSKHKFSIYSDYDDIDQDDSPYPGNDDDNEDL